MQVFRGIAAAAGQVPGSAVAIGNFDGVHVGHRALLDQAHAVLAGGRTVVLTFEPHPAKVLAPALAPPLLVTLERKLELLADAGVDAVVVEPFTRELAGLAPESFVSDLLVGALDVLHVVVGYDFTYGRKRGGNVESLAAAGRVAGFGVHVVPQVTVDGLVASSTKVREFVLEGNMAGAALLLGRPFDLRGLVVRGAGRGRSIGIPTANLRAESELLPGPGVYAARAHLLGPAGTVESSHAAAVNLGTNPTFVEQGGLSLEAHLIEFDGDLYGRRLQLDFVARLRAERRFPGVDALVAQIREDVREATRLLA